MSQGQWILSVLWLAVASSVAGQTTNVTQCISSYNWSINALGQNPCLVAAYLESACGIPGGINIPAIPDVPGDHYLGPTTSQANPCLCSSVTYSMISACAGCQNGTYTDWVTWSDDCTQVLFTTFLQPLPPSVEVPSWAFLNLTLTGNNFSVVAAEQNASASAASASASASSAIMTSTSVIIPTVTPTASASKSKSNAGAIAGGVVGGLVFIAIVTLGALWFRIRRKRKMVQQAVPFDSQAALVSGTAMSQITGSIQGSSPPSQSIYTSDMSIYPGSPIATSGVYTSGIPPSRRSLESISPSLAQFGGGPQTHSISNVLGAGYAGTPEIMN